MYRITKQFHFSASHQLIGLADDHPCARLHGHNYIVEIELQAETLSSTGFVRDYHELAALKEYIDEHLDHRHLNDVLGDDNVTAEQIAKYLFDWCASLWPETSAMRVSETHKTWAEFRP
jgi:6-pyruvoyltetrahydropterin/6-carboxytetrahydropterin synthase